MTGLLELADRCERATGPDAYLDLDIHKAINPDMAECYTLTDAPNYCGSLDAAMTLVGDDVFFHVSRFSPEDDGRGQAHVYPNRGLGDDYEAEAATPALALCAAALRARAAQGEPS